MIYILTGDIRTGKTTALQNWIKDRDDVDGLLCPDNAKGKRYFLKVKSKTSFPLEIESGHEADIIHIGSFLFLKSAFQNANDYLLDSNQERAYPFLLIDELGKLELRNKGLHASAKILIPQYIMNEHWHLILVVRETLIEDVLKHYRIFKYRILKKEDLEQVE